MNKINPAAHLGLVWKIAKKYAAKCNEPVEDLVQEGYFGLVKAAEGFDPDRGMQFSSYAHWWIHSAISHHLRETRTVHIPDPLSRRLRKAGEMPPQVSLDADESMLLSFLRDEGPSPEEAVSTKEERTILWNEVGKLPRRWKNVLRMRYMLGQTMDQVGETLGVTRQAIQQTEMKALRALRPRLEKAFA